jgi:predicted NAD/FAD-dependent oxidoreductase
VKKWGPVAIIGGGLSGISCAHALQMEDVEVRLFERAAMLGGRCATRLWQGHLIDHGVQYFTAHSTDFKKELLTRLRQFRPLVSPILDQDERLVMSTTGPRFYVLQGNNYLAHVLSHGVEAQLNSLVESVSFQGSKFDVLGESFRAVVSAIPGPGMAKVFGLSHPPVEYEPILTAMLEYANDGLEPGRHVYGRVMPEDSPVIAASYCENHKAGRIIGNKTVFVVNASAHFSAAHVNDAPETYLPEIIREHEKLWHIAPGLCRASSIHVWRHGRPLEKTRQKIETPPGLFLCGDSRSHSTVEDVWLDGRRAAEETLAYLKQQA